MSKPPDIIDREYVFYWLFLPVKYIERKPEDGCYLQSMVYEKEWKWYLQHKLQNFVTWTSKRRNLLTIHLTSVGKKSCFHLKSWFYFLSTPWKNKTNFCCYFCTSLWVWRKLSVDLKNSLLSASSKICPIQLTS